MNVLVNFVCVKFKKELENYEDYSNKLLNVLLTIGIINNANCYPIADEDNVFSIEYSEHSCEWSIILEYSTYAEIKQLDISICCNEYVPTIENDYLEKLKLRLKNCIKIDWEQIIWLYDKDAAVLSVDLYSKFYHIENSLRRFIYESMIKNVGAQWWDEFADSVIKAKYRKRVEDYKSVVEEFKNIDDHLMSIDVGDLKNIFFRRKEKWIPKNNQIIEGILNGSLEYNQNRVIDLLKSQLELDVDLWDKYFSKYFDEDFKMKFDEFEKNRNHIAHNKLLDRAAYKKINANIITMDNYIIAANKKLSKDVYSVEDKKKLEIQQQKELLEYMEYMRDIKELDSNLNIRTGNEICNILSEAAHDAYQLILDSLYFREDIEISKLQLDKESNDGIFFSVNSKISSESIIYNYSIDIIDEEGKDSSLSIYDNDEKSMDYEERFQTCIVYTNGEVEYNEESLLYEPITQDGIEKDNIDIFVEKVVNDINCKITNYKQQVDDSIYQLKKAGLDLPVVEELYCEECGEEYICIDESIAPFGTCLNCGYQNKIVLCERCGIYYEEDTNSEIKLCSNCRDYYEKQ